MKFAEATKNYEEWMRRCAPVIKSHLSAKHVRMREDPFLFLRGSYYRWAQLWPRVCRELTRAPKVLSVGDLHVDNYGTWRDGEGRLCWGVNDFDESWPLPYTNDLVRLATSAWLAKDGGLLRTRTKHACAVLLEGYRDTLHCGGSPFVLAERERRLEQLGIAALKTPKYFWERLNEHPTVGNGLLPDAKKALVATLPHAKLPYRVIRREAGTGSLGRERLVAIATYCGGFIAREAKQMVPSANMWLEGGVAHEQRYYKKAIDSAIRSHDPYQTITGSWLIRRLSPDSTPIRMEMLPKERDEETLLHAMGVEIANVHLGNARAVKNILKDLHHRKTAWLRSATKTMVELMIREWKEYKKS